MLKIKLLLLRLAEAPFAGIVHFVSFINRFTCKPVLYNVSTWAFRIHCNLNDIEARLLGYNGFYDLFEKVLVKIAVHEDDPSEHDDYDDADGLEDDNEI